MERTYTSRPTKRNKDAEGLSVVKGVIVKAVPRIIGEITKDVVRHCPSCIARKGSGFREMA